MGGRGWQRFLIANGMNFAIGCAIWAYKGWIGDFFPVGSRSSEFLRLYSRRFTAVEGNTTFYVVPDKETVNRWRSQTPPEFKFCLKLPKDVTHSGLLQPTIGGALRFLDQMQGLESRLGPLFAQLPPSYSPAQLTDLIAFLTAWTATQTPLALEVRHPDWFQEPHASQLRAILTDLGIGRVLLDSRPIYEGTEDPQLHSERRKPKLPLQPSVTAPFSLIRFISHPNWEANQAFWLEWVPIVDQWLREGTQAYFFVHCPAEEQSPNNARQFQRLLEEHEVPVPALPWNQIKPPPTQLSLF